ncbi:hypothetical protein ACOME3_001271 [Neoechinorhynchus agilis]
MQAGRYLSTLQLIQSIGLMVAMPMFIKKFQMKNITLVIIGMICKLSYFLVLGFARSSLVLYSALCVTIFLCIDAPSIHSMLVSLIEQHEHGEVFGIQSAFQSTGYLLSQLVLQPIYKVSVKTRFPGSVFIFCSGIVGIAVLVICVSTIGKVFIKDANTNRKSKKSRNLVDSPAL